MDEKSKSFIDFNEKIVNFEVIDNKDWEICDHTRHMEMKR